MRRQKALALVLSSLLLEMIPTSYALAQSPTADQIMARILEKNAERQTALQHYATDRVYKLEYTGIGGEHHAEMTVHAEYDAPGKKHLTITSESGSKPLCHEVLRKLVEDEQETAEHNNWQKAMFSPDTYNAELVGRESLEGISTFVLQVEPKASTKNAFRGKIWVSANDYAIVRMQGEPAKNPSWLLNHASFDTWYMRRGDVWVPEKNDSTTHVRLGGEAHVTIDYGRYPVLTTEPVNTASVQTTDFTSR